jgi:hypothetical protein
MIQQRSGRKLLLVEVADDCCNVKMKATLYNNLVFLMRACDSCSNLRARLCRYQDTPMFEAVLSTRRSDEVGAAVAELGVHGGC